MRLSIAIQTGVLALALAACPRAGAGETTNAPAPVTARDFYNTGTELLTAKKYAEAEKMFQSALALQDDQVRPAALYNGSQARFAGGLERLKQGPDAQKAAGQGDAALAAGEAAMQQSESALAGNNLSQMVIAYLQGRGARRDLREAEKAVSAAMDTYGKTLEDWQRSADDFKGVAELNTADTNAARNAQIVEEGIARLVDSVRKMRAMMGMMGQQRQDLGKLMSKLKGQIPAMDAPPGMVGDEDNDDDTIKPESLIGKEEGEGRGGQQIQRTLSPDQASDILNGLPLDGTRRLQMSDKEGTPPADRKGRNW